MAVTLKLINTKHQKTPRKWCFLMVNGLQLNGRERVKTLPITMVILAEFIKISQQKI